MNEVIIVGIVFTGIYQAIKVFTDYLLKRRLIMSGNVDKASILDAHKDKEEISYPTLKWGLVSLFAGIGLVVISLIQKNMNDQFFFQESYVSIGVELIAISLGFLVYFFIVRRRTK